MVKKLVSALAACCLLLSVNASAEETQSEPYYDTSKRDEAAREATLQEEAEKSWKSKPPHSHTLDDAKNSAKQEQKSNPRHLLRDSTKEEQMQKSMEANMEQNMKANMKKNMEEMSTDK